MATNKISLKEPTWEALEEFLADSMMSIFLTDETKDVIRKKMKGQLITRAEYQAGKKVKEWKKHQNG